MKSSHTLDRYWIALVLVLGLIVAAHGLAGNAPRSDSADNAASNAAGDLVAVNWNSAITPFGGPNVQ